MFYLLAFIIFHEVMFVVATFCNPANYICSGKCHDVPPKLTLHNGVPMCLKDSVTKGCVCWLSGEYKHEHSWFHCEALINGSVKSISCQTPEHCFTTDAKLTCLVIPYCECRLINDNDLPHFQFGAWRPIKGIVKLFNNSENRPSDIREFSLKHLLFLLGFVIAPLACWCLLSFINETKCKRKNVSAVDSSGNTERRPITNRHVSQATPATPCNFGLLNSTNANASLHRFTNFPIFCPPCSSNVSASAVSTEPACPPSYDEATYPNIESDDEGPPSYAEAVHGCEQELLQTMLVIHPGQGDEG